MIKQLRNNQLAFTAGRNIIAQNERYMDLRELPPYGSISFLENDDDEFFDSRQSPSPPGSPLPPR